MLKKVKLYKRLSSIVYGTQQALYGASDAIYALSRRAGYHRSTLDYQAEQAAIEAVKAAQVESRKAVAKAQIDVIVAAERVVTLEQKVHEVRKSTQDNEYKLKQEIKKLGVYQ